MKCFPPFRALPVYTFGGYEPAVSEVAFPKTRSCVSRKISGKDRSQELLRPAANFGSGRPEKNEDKQYEKELPHCCSWYR